MAWIIRDKLVGSIVNIFPAKYRAERELRRIIKIKKRNGVCADTLYELIKSNE